MIPRSCGPRYRSGSGRPSRGAGSIRRSRASRPAAIERRRAHGERAARFWERVLGQPGTRVSPGRHYFDCEGTILACFDPKADGDGYDATPLPEPIYLAVDDLEATFRNAADTGAVFPRKSLPGVGPLGEIADRPWGERSFYAADPFGNRLCFVSRGSMFRG